MAPARSHGRFLAGEAGDLAGVSGTTIGQWARRGYIRASRSAGDPHVYSLEDVVEAAAVHALIERGVGHAAIRRTIEALHGYGDWPLTVAPLATTSGDGGPRILLAEAGGIYALSGRGWQRLAVEPPLRRLRAGLVGLPAAASAADAPDGP